MWPSSATSAAKKNRFSFTSSSSDNDDTTTAADNDNIQASLLTNSSREESRGTNYHYYYRHFPWKLAWNALLVMILAGVLFLTYDSCIGCVIGIAIISALTMNCIPLMPLVFILSIIVLLYHAIDYNKATLRVEVPLQDFVHIPTWNDVQKYVHVAPPQKTP